MGSLKLLTCLTPVVDTSELAALVPELMARHPGHVWTVRSGEAKGADLLIEMRPVGSPDRVATLHVFAGAEVFSLGFAGHNSTDYAYKDEDRTEALRERIDLGAAATLGPGRVTLDRCDEVIGSTMVIDPDGQSPREDTVVSWPFRRLRARLTGRRVSRQVIDYPKVGSAQEG